MKALERLHDYKIENGKFLEIFQTDYPKQNILKLIFSKRLSLHIFAQGCNSYY